MNNDEELIPPPPLRNLLAIRNGVFTKEKTNGKKKDVNNPTKTCQCEEK